jgi:predicted transcriptional regulator
VPCGERTFAVAAGGGTPERHDVIHPESAMPSARRSTIYLDPELHRQLRRISAEDERTVSEMVNVAVAAYLDAGAPAGAGVAGEIAAPTGTAGTAGSAGGAKDGGTVDGRAESASSATVVAAPMLPPGWSAPAAVVPEGLAPPVRRLFGVLRVGDPEAAMLRAVAATRAGA